MMDVTGYQIKLSGGTYFREAFELRMTEQSPDDPNRWRAVKGTLNFVFYNGNLKHAALDPNEIRV